jgi:hypothetical protein
MSTTARWALIAVVASVLLVYLFGAVGAVIVALGIAVLILRELPTEVTGWKHKDEL